MGAFEYTAVDAAGRERKGVIEGDTPRHARSLLREQQLLPVTVEAVAAQESRRALSGGLSLRRGLSATDLSLLTRQIATLVRAGLPLEEALLAVSQQTEKPRVQSIVMGVRARVMEGHTLAAGLTDFPRVFPEIYRATVAAGEHSGHLDAVLERLAEYTESREQMQQKVFGALLYPLVLTVMCFGIVSVLLTYVVPKVVEVFEANRAKLPLMTRVLVVVSDFLRGYGLWLLIGIAAASFIGWRALQSPAMRRRFHRVLLRLPLAGKIVRGFNAARFTRTLSILTASAVPVLDALRISSEVITSLPMRDAVNEAASAVARRRTYRPLVGRKPPVSTHDHPPDLQRRIERRARGDARSGGRESGARTRDPAGRAGRTARSGC